MVLHRVFEVLQSVEESQVLQHIEGYEAASQLLPNLLWFFQIYYVPAEVFTTSIKARCSFDSCNQNQTCKYFCQYIPCL
jgi:hypothetical protein